MSTLPLDGMRVIDFGQYIAAPGAGQQLADLGADVVKVESLDGDQARSVGRFGAAMLDAYNRGKRSIAVDLRRPESTPVIEALCARSDVLLHNFRCGSAERLGIGAAAIRDRFPHLVYAFVTGFGSRGPSAGRAGLDIAAQAEYGLMHTNGEPDGEPQRVPFPIADVLAANALASGVLAALVRRGRTGTGSVVETSLMEAVTAAQATQWSGYRLTGEPPRRTGNGQPAVAPAAEYVRAQDGAIVVSAYTTTKWTALCAALGAPELAADPRFADNDARVAHRRELCSELEHRLGTRTRREATALLSAHGIVCGTVRSFDELDDDADLLASGLLLQPGAGGSGALGTPYRIDDSPRGTAGPVPQVGEHTRTVLRELGHDDDTVDRLLADGVLGEPTGHDTATEDDHDR
ncbi:MULTISPECIES: CoA transferase [unclassified Pseudonocardia]|uniref:CaiB/BaiF CoA transferase family protein n=1 Tax=unclassified Pseudonocardia TaxID=2619320 RepID=UPI0001FFE42B|nr:CoA transferase [Pseudonocardia sp. Ae707_Ps1]OLM18605.1 CAIB/BAIF family protein [Pseudonocardia sp. Ae707_Ps1]